MALLPCPYLGGEVELTAEREAHIRLRHPTLLPQHLDLVAETIRDPDKVRRAMLTEAQLMFVREFETLGAEPQVVVVVLEDEPRSDIEQGQFWVVTAYRSDYEYVAGRLVWER